MLKIRKPNTLIYIVLLVILSLVASACTKQQENELVSNGMEGMPCHRMPNGELMGDCDGVEETQGEETMGMMSQQATFRIGSSADSSSLKVAKPTSILDLEDGDEVDITAEIVLKEIDGQTFRMYAYNGRIPGIALRVKQNSKITVNFHNKIDQETTIHWHGLRHDIKDDGVPGISQDPVKPGESYVYSLFFPDEGIYWYHPHVREDIQQEGGLAGNMLVVPSDPDYWNPVNREELLVLDDLLIRNGELMPFGKEYATHSTMGRFGNVLLTNGDTNYSLSANEGEVIRFYITNAANVRPFKLSFGGARMKLVGSDMGKYEREEFVEGVIMAPGERYIVEVYFDKAGKYYLEHNTPEKRYMLGEIQVSGSEAKLDYSSYFNNLKTNEDISEEIDEFRQYFEKPVDYSLVLDIDMPGMQMMGEAENHESIEWEDTMQQMNEMMDSSDMTWILKEENTGKENMDISMDSKVGDKVKIRIFNDPESMHPMQHPIHLHGQRFLILKKNDVPADNLVWKDTVLVGIGETVEILVDVTNPGEWMMHCHIAEHLEAGMMAEFSVG